MNGNIIIKLLSINYKCYTNVRGAFDFDRKTG